MLALIGLMVYVARKTVPVEEAKLLLLFGAAYQTYRSRVGRWL
jgi:protein-S-isoprenylcysteine O-methyltransferase Ste14